MYIPVTTCDNQADVAADTLTAGTEDAVPAGDVTLESIMQTLQKMTEAAEATKQEQLARDKAKDLEIQTLNDKISQMESKDGTQDRGHYCNMLSNAQSDLAQCISTGGTCDRHIRAVGDLSDFCDGQEVDECNNWISLQQQVLLCNEEKRRCPDEIRQWQQLRGICGNAEAPRRRISCEDLENEFATCNQKYPIRASDTQKERTQNTQKCLAAMNRFDRCTNGYTIDSGSSTIDVALAECDRRFGANVYNNAQKRKCQQNANTMHDDYSLDGVINGAYDLWDDFTEWGYGNAEKTGHAIQRTLRGRESRKSGYNNGEYDRGI
jgi:hypothetical protein